MKLFTIGFTQTTAAHFFGRLKRVGVKKLVDVRLNNASQLAGFAKVGDLGYFAQAICGIETEHMPVLAPTPVMLEAYRAAKAAKSKDAWRNYTKKFRRLIAQRKIEALDPTHLDGACLLCSEALPHHCHRRLVAEYLREKWGDVEVVDL
jgi:uncharacterized protein (DUF488 family)